MIILKIKNLIVIPVFAISVFSSTHIETVYSKTIQSDTIKLRNLTKLDTININALSEGFNLDVVVLKKSAPKSRLPAVIFIVGSGMQSSMNTNRDFMQFFFEKTLLQNGFAIVYFDKRGVGNSEGIWYETTFEQRAIDAKNVALEIKNLDFIDNDKVFIVGHSQGGWIVQIALASYPKIFAGGISMAGPTFGVKMQLINDYKSGFLCKGYNESQSLKKAQRKVNRDLFFVSLFGRKGNLKQLKIIKSFEPKSYIKSINQPLLMMFAENDPLVSPVWSVEELKKIFPNGLPSNFEYYIAQHENHSFKVAPKCYDGKWQDLYFSETTRELMFEWIKAQSTR